MENRKNVLIISRDDSIQGSISVITQVSKSLNLDITGCVTTYSQAIEHIQRAMPDLIMCDTGIQQESDGIEIMRHIIKLHPVPVFFFLKDNQPQIVDQTQEFTTLGLMLKPLNLIQLKINLKLTLAKSGLFV